MPRYTMPYSSSNMFYDESWRQKQERAFTAWLNYTLTPDEFKTTVNADVVNKDTKKGKF